MARNGTDAAVDIESGQPLPLMLEPPEIRWALIRKLYAILAVQLLWVKPISNFVLNTTPGPAVFIVSLILPFILLCPLAALRKRQPVNFVLLALFSVAIGFGVGLCCGRVHGEVVVKALILTSMVLVSLTLHTFWVVKRGKDFSFLGPFLFDALLVLIMFGFIQIVFPLGKLLMKIYGLLSALIFCRFIVYDTDRLMKRFSNDVFIWASISLYLDIMNLFLSLLILLKAADR